MRALVTALGACLLLAGCGSEDGGSTLTVSAASSLTDVFGGLERRFEAAHPGVDVVLNLGSSSELASQIVNGAPVDVFASADTAQMARVAEAGLVAGEPTVFATNVLRIAVAPGNPEDVAGFADLTAPDLAVVTCAPQVPCGAAAERVERATGLTLTPVSEEPDVRSVLSKVTSRNADAGLVYVTDVRSADGAVDGVEFPEARQAVNDYPVATLAGTAEPEHAAAFVELVTGPEGQRILRDAGFGMP